MEAEKRCFLLQGICSSKWKDNVLNNLGFECKNNPPNLVPSDYFLFPNFQREFERNFLNDLVTIAAVYSSYQRKLEKQCAKIV